MSDIRNEITGTSTQLIMPLAMQPVSSSIPAISLFAGAGGLDIGFEHNGFEIVLANEIVHDAAETYRANRTNLNGGLGPNLLECDVMSERFDKALTDTIAIHPDVGVVFGGCPCQSWSLAGNMGGMNDPRGRLLWRFLDIVSVVHPACFLIENVAALAEAAKWQTVRDGLLERAEAIGYDMTSIVLDATDYGVSQARKRAFFLGTRRDMNLDAGQFETRLDETRGSEPTRTAGEVLRACGRYGSDENPVTSRARITLMKRPILRPSSPWSGMIANGRGRPINIHDVAPTMVATSGGNHTPIVDDRELWEGTENWFVGYVRGLRDGTVQPEGTVVPPYVRRLTTREAMAFQTFPDGYEFCGSDNSVYTQIGNAVPCKLADAVADAVRNVMMGG